MIMYQKDVTVVSLMFLALYSGSLLSLTGISLPVIDYVTIYSFLYVCLQCLLKCGTLLIVRSAPFGRVWPSDMCLVHGWVQECYPVLKWFSKLYIERETERDMAWTRDLWVCCVAFGIRILAVELLGPAGYTVGCAGIELILVHPMDA